MQKKVLIISSDNTGHGHKSITESLSEKIGVNSDDLKLHVVDGFSLGGKFLYLIGSSYGPITRTAENLWKIVWKLTAIKASLVNNFIELQIKRKFLQLIEEVEPDVILSVHPNFNGSILNILEKQKIKIPFLTLIADLVNIYPLWADRRADYIICPTEEAKEKCREFGVPEEKIAVLGFPVRSRFFANDKNLQVAQDQQTPLTCLIMSGGEGIGNMKSIAENMLDNFDCRVKIITGRNEKLKAELEESLSRYGEKVEVYGFTKNIQDLMFASDIALTRGSPNTPLIITGALPGQEEDNPAFAQKLNLGVVCNYINNIKPIIEDILKNDGYKLNIIKRSQKAFINDHAAEDIFQFILETEKLYYQEETNYEVSLLYN
ncbi:UDP-N-acetylglucosamine--LPS N-acetylglucosamine transferase [Halobacillus sp. A5]|uniref:MGDG synthase family glycosyltransferase n=1 Tax=Halobacillus sp. A5 TaxID=2880263 RepID=UPI0020A6513F|nr:UDP-N-acetylglucosamine--LPS N-acetylglucosamine transferase [Halobacillus sp. A5]MCP3025368.1 UDP-N-acetylglucosamine--LPS N-acetylglucosamine transferase [Halobacillus sp. A5]